MALGDYSGMQRFGAGLRGTSGALGAGLMQRKMRIQQQKLDNQLKTIYAQHTVRNPTTGKMQQDREGILAGLQTLGPQGINLAMKQGAAWSQQDALQTRAKKEGKKKFGLTPIYGQKEGGGTGVMRMTEAGLEELTLPEGITDISRGVDRVDLGDRVMFYDKDGNFIGTKKKKPPPETQPGYKAAQAKAVQKATGKISPEEEKAAGQELVSNTAKELKNLFEELRNLPGGIVDVEKDSFSNVVARLSASKLGQTFQKALGTKVQSVRNKIEAMRPTLINQIRKATQMGARGLDSEKELEFYLKSVTDPTLDFQFNINALRVLDNAYGLGMGLEPGIKVYKPETKTEPGLKKQPTEPKTVQDLGTKYGF